MILLNMKPSGIDFDDSLKTKISFHVIILLPGNKRNCLIKEFDEELRNVFILSEECVRDL